MSRTLWGDGGMALGRSYEGRSENSGDAQCRVDYCPHMADSLVPGIVADM